MTTTLVLSTLVGAATGIQLLKYFSQIDFQKLQARANRLEEGLGFTLPFLASLIFVLYPSPFAIVVLSMAFASAISPLLIAALILFAVLGTRIFIIFLLIIVIGSAANHSALSSFWKGFSLRRVSLFVATGIILAEIALLGANTGFLPVAYPGLWSLLGDKRAVPALIIALKEGEGKVGHKAHTELLQIGEPAVPALMDMVNSLNIRDRRRAAAILIKLGHAKTIRDTAKDPAQTFISVLGYQNQNFEYGLGYTEDESRQVGEIAIEELKKFDSDTIESAIPQLIAILKRHDLYGLQYSSAYQMLKQLPLERVLPKLLQSFEGQQNTTEFDPGAILSSYGLPAIPYLVDGLSSPDTWARYWAKQALVNMQDAGIEPLSKVLLNGNKDARATAATGLGQIKNPVVLPLLIKALNDESLEVRTNALWALGYIGDRNATQALIDYCKKYPSQEALQAIRKLNGPAAVPLAVQFFDSLDTSKRQMAFDVLSEFHWVDKMKEVPIYLGQLHDSDLEVRYRSAEELSKIGDYTVLPLLKKADSDLHHSNRSLSKSPCRMCHAIKVIKSRQ